MRKETSFFCNERNREECTEYSERDRLLSIMEQIPVGFAAGSNSCLVYFKISRFLLCQEIPLFASLIVPSGVRNNMKKRAALYCINLFRENIKEAKQWAIVVDLLSSCQQFCDWFVSILNLKESRCCAILKGKSRILTETLFPSSCLLSSLNKQNEIKKKIEKKI